MQSNWTVASAMILALVLVGCGKEDPVEPECAVGEACVCEVDLDCPEPIEERCDVDQGVCVARAGVGTGGDAGDDADAEADAGQDLNLDDLDPELDMGDIPVDGFIPNTPEVGDDSRAEPGAEIVPEVIEDDAFELGVLETISEVSVDTTGPDGEEIGEPTPDSPLETDLDEPWGADVVELANECLGEADREAIEADDALSMLEAGLACKGECVDMGCLQTCVEVNTGLTSGCAGCFVRQAECAGFFCEDACAGGDEACNECFFSTCIDLLEPCLGFPIGEVEEVFAYVQMLHLSPDSRALSIFLGDSTDPMASGVEFRSGTGLLEIPPSETGFAIRFSDDDGASPALLNVIPDFGYGAGTQLVVGVIGEFGTDTPSLTSVLLREDTSTPPEGFRWRLINAAPRSGAINVYDTSNPAAPAIVFDGLLFTEVIPDRSRAATAFSIGIDEDRDSVSDHIYEVGPFAEDSQATFWFAHDDAGTPFLAATLSDGTVATFTSGGD